jgi:hypothetical protein
MPAANGQGKSFPTDGIFGCGDPGDGFRMNRPSTTASDGRIGIRQTVVGASTMMMC